VITVPAGTVVSPGTRLGAIRRSPPAPTPQVKQGFTNVHNVTDSNGRNVFAQLESSHTVWKRLPYAPGVRARR
jgi:hypothetical protein